VAGIHEKYATALFQKGDFEGAMTNYIAAKASPIVLLRRFPDLVPSALHAAAGIELASSSSSTKLSGVVLQRAAAALATFCAHHRPALAQAADRVGGGEEAASLAELVDTVLLFSLVHCSPPRKSAVIEVLSSGPNRVHIESAAVLLASQGNAFTEALLWLYRSHHEHRRVLAALTEERCVGTGAWSQEQFYAWTADYLRWLWYHDSDASLPPLALSALRPVLEYDASLGLGVLTVRPRGGGSGSKGAGAGSSSAWGGKGVTVQEVVSFLESVQPSTLSARDAASVPRERQSKTSSSKHQQVGDVAIPLINGRALGVSYLEWLVGTGHAPASMHDEFAQLLVEGIPPEKDFDHRARLDFAGGDSESRLLYKIYRRKLQAFLLNSLEYHPDKVLKMLPPHFLHEYALVLARLGRHADVLNVYVEQLGDVELAEQYCARAAPSSSSSSSSSGVYLMLAETVLQRGAGGVDEAIQIAERNFDKLEPLAFLDLLPSTVPLAGLARYLDIVFEHTNTRKRNLQVSTVY